jgi:carbamoyl-phosphate synthase/aspartate carbamoyltransferase
MALSKPDPPMALELEDGYHTTGFSFGAPKSISGEFVFQTGMVGYPESLTDPSYRGQILVITFPLVGNYGVPSREVRDALLADLPAYFESHEIHVAGLVVASYAGEEYSHYLASSSLGSWLKEQGVPAVYGIDTRLLTKRIREKGSMLGKLLQQKTVLGSIKSVVNGLVNGGNGYASGTTTPRHDWRGGFEDVEWVNPNEKNLVAEGEGHWHSYARFGQRS